MTLPPGWALLVVVSCPLWIGWPMPVAWQGTGVHACGDDAGAGTHVSAHQASLEVGPRIR